MISTSRLALLVSLASAASILLPAPIHAQRAFGPLSVSEQNPLYRLLYVPVVESADVVAPGRWKLDVSTAYSNIFERSSSNSHVQLFDMEQMTNGFTLRYGIHPDWEVGGRLGIRTDWGGFLDGFVSGFHDFFGFPNGERGEEPKGQYRFLLASEDPSVSVDLPRETMALEDLRAFAKWRFHGSGESSTALALRGTMRVSTGPVDAGRADGALAVYGRASGGRLHLHGSAGVTTLNPPARLDPLFATSAFFFSYAMEVRAWETLSFVGQMSAETRYLEGEFGRGELDKLPILLVFGFRGRHDNDWGWQFTFSEDFPPDSPAVDFTVGLHLERRF